MKSRFVALAAMLAIPIWFTATGCGDECDDACTKIEDCGVPVPANVKCDCDTARDECAADCVNAASCDEIRGTSPNSQYATCLIGCI